MTLDTLPQILQFCRSQAVALLIARCPAEEPAVAHAMEREGFSLMDTLVYFARDLGQGTPGLDAGRALVRPVRPGEEEAVREVAADAFRGYGGHYHADPKLDRSRCDETYSDWAYRSCIAREVADEVLVACQDGSPVGFVALRRNSPAEGEGTLFGVAPRARGRGIGRALMVHALEWCVSSGAARMVISTQVTNTRAQRIWTRLGFEATCAYYTFHKWFGP